MRIAAYLKIARPANIITAISDIIAGFAIAGVLFQPSMELHGESMILLLLATIGLYGGGIVFNDVFDLEEDKVNRPERVLPSGQLSKRQAVIFGTGLFSVGVACAFAASPLSGVIALLITVLALSYDKYGKHHSFLGPINMGLCRSMNLFLGVSIVGDRISEFWFIGFIPLAFVAAITLVGQKEAHGNNKKSILQAISLDTLVVLFFVGLILKGYLNIWATIPFLLFWYGINLVAKTKALVQNTPKQIQLAVKTGVLSLIPLNAIYVAGFSNWYYGLILIGLLPLSILVAKYYSVT